MISERPKKNSIDSKRAIFFQLGLIISIFSVITFMNFTYSTEVPAMVYEQPGPPFEDPNVITIIKEEQKKQGKQTNKEEQKKFDPNDIEFVTKDIDSVKEPEQLILDTSLFALGHETEPEPNDDPVPFVAVGDKPRFQGGEEGLYKFIGNHLTYPRKAISDGKQGVVTMYFIIEKDGSVSNIKVLKGVSPEIDAAAIRVLGLMPDWTPGSQRSKPVRVSFVMPISFKLN